MSYLHSVRLHFAGRFRADISTVNNHPSRYPLEDFRPEFQMPGSSRDNWQPQGTGSWRLMDCSVRRACRADGVIATDALADGAVGLAVAEASDRPSAKLVDLDPQGQVSSIWGLAIRLVDPASGAVLLSSEFETTPFFDLYFNRLQHLGPGDFHASSYFQSTLHDIAWGDISASPALQSLAQRTEAGRLSIKFVTESYKMSGPERGYGRLVGTIGPYFEGEPHRFVVGRHLKPVEGTGMAHVVCKLDEPRRKLFVDLGNALPIASVDGDFANVGTLRMVLASADGERDLGAIDYLDAGYESTAGVFEFPVGRALTDEELLALSESPLRLKLQPDAASVAHDAASESVDGIYIRPDQLVFRLNPGEVANIALLASRFGQPMANAEIDVTMPLSDALMPPPLPDCPASVTTNADGRAVLTLTARDPGSARQSIDGLLYEVMYQVRHAAENPFEFDDSNVVSILVFTGGSVPAVVTWNHVQPMLQQYANLYPRPHGRDPYAPLPQRPPVHPVVDLSDYVSVAAFHRHLKRALSLPIEHPNHMPVTRDLSGVKRATLLKWLDDLDTDGKPRRGPVIVADPVTVPHLRAAASAPIEPEIAALGGKTVAAILAGFPNPPIRRGAPPFAAAIARLKAKGNS